MATDRTVTAQVSQKLAVRVDELAQRLDRPRAWVIKEALEQYVALERKRYELTKEALADVRAGRVVDHAHVEQWAASLRTKRRRPSTRSKRRS